jgi:hypothetical protein
MPTMADRDRPSSGPIEAKTDVSVQRRNQRESNRRGVLPSAVSHHDNSLARINKTILGKPRLRRDMAGGAAPGGGNGVIVIDPNVDRLLFLLTAAFFAFAVARSAYLLFG